MAFPMNLPLPTPRRSWPGRLVNIAATLIVLAVAAGMFVLSYSGMRALALEAGVSAQLSRLFPGLFDAVLVIACVAAVVLRDGRWWARYWAWLVIIVVLAAIGATDVAHAVNYSLPHRGTEAAVAAAPLVAVLLAFSLLLTMLRHSRGQAARHPAPQPIQALPALSADAAAQPAPQPAPPIPLPAADAQKTPTEPVPVPNPGPAAAPTRADPAIGDYWDADGSTTGNQKRNAEIVVADSGTEPSTAAGEPETPADANASPFATAPFTAMPRLNRVRATPTPPGDEEREEDGA
jgi:hypothetical protein